MVPGNPRGAPLPSSEEPGIGQVELGKAAQEPREVGWCREGGRPSAAGGPSGRGAGGGRGCSPAADARREDSLRARWQSALAGCSDLVLSGWYLRFCPSSEGSGGRRTEVRGTVTGKNGEEGGKSRYLGRTD